jgi:streptogramin lyase
MIVQTMRAVALFVAWIAAASAMAHPGSAIAVANDGRVWFVDTGGGVFSILNGRVARHEGSAFHWFAFDAQGRFRNTRWPHIPGGTIQTAGPVILSSDFPVTIGSNGVFYYPNGTRIMSVQPNGATALHTTLPGAIRWINGLAPGANGTLYYTEDAAVRKIDARGRVTTVAERISVPNCVSIPGNTRPYLRGLAVAPDGTVYVAASGCGALLKIDPRGRVAPLLRTAAPWAPTDVAVRNGEVYVLEYSHTASEDDRTKWYPRVRRIGRDGKVTNLGGSGRR